MQIRLTPLQDRIGHMIAVVHIQADPSTLPLPTLSKVCHDLILTCRQRTILTTDRADFR